MCWYNRRIDKICYAIKNLSHKAYLTSAHHCFTATGHEAKIFRVANNLRTNAELVLLVIQPRLSRPKMEQLLTTKLYIPSTRPELFPRLRPIRRITQGLQRKQTIISAPAGYGKTTLVSEWADNFRLDSTKANQIDNKIA